MSPAGDPLISAATVVETSIVMLAKTGPNGVSDLDELLAAAAVRCVAVDTAQAHLAREAYARFGRGRDPAGLNWLSRAHEPESRREWELAVRKALVDAFKREAKWYRAPGESLTDPSTDLRLARRGCSGPSPTREWRSRLLTRPDRPVLITGDLFRIG